MGATAKTLDFSNVSEGSQFRTRRRPEGDYYAHIVDVADHKSKAGDAMWLVTIKIDGDPRSAYPHYLGLDANQLWKIRNLFVAAGIGVPSKRVKADPNKLVGKAIGVALEDDEYEGRVKSTIAAVFPIDDIEDGMNEPKSGKGKSSKSRPVDDDGRDVAEERILLQPRGQDAFGDNGQPGVGGGAAIEPDVPSDLAAERPALLGSDPPRDGSRGHASRLQQQDRAVAHQRGRHACGLAGARRGRDDQRAAVTDDARDLGQEGIDWKRVERGHG